MRKDRALATDLTYGVLRWRGRLDWVIGQLSTTPVHKIDPFVLNILRLGLYQILFLSRVPLSAAVNESVELAKAKAPSWVVRFVNGVMRAAARKAKGIPLPGDDGDPARALAIRESHPLWLVERWLKRYGAEETRRLCQANNQVPPVTVRVNTLKTSREVLLVGLRDDAREIAPTRYAPDGISLRGLKGAVDEIPCFKEGLFHVQDEGAQLIGHFVDPKPGEHVLDACAGFGGKAGQIAQLMKNRGKVTAMDNQLWKLLELQGAMMRLGVSAVSTWHHDLSTSTPVALAGAFDRILLDAPCSGLGVLRRNPDAKWKRDEADIARLASDQHLFLGCLAPLVKTGGILVYAVCSLEPEEGEQVVRRFLEEQTGFVVDRGPGEFPSRYQGMMDRSGFFRSLPYKHQMDGFFAVRMKRVAP
jgi:16S rRNA (cytosine967-C5)-methyltransferase